MATLPKSLPFFFFFFFFLLFSLQTLARDLHSFSKITRQSDLQNTQPNKDKEDDQQPAFLPQTGRDAYGLYARQPDSLSPFSAAKTSDDRPLYSPQTNMEEFQATPATADAFHHRKNYAAELQGLGGSTNSGDYFNEENLGARFVENGRDGYDVNNQKQVNVNNGYQGGYGQPEYYDNKGYYRGGGAQESGRYYETNSYSGMRRDQSMEEAEEFQFDP